MSHRERLALISALMAWRDVRAFAYKPSQFWSTKAIAAVVYR